MRRLIRWGVDNSPAMNTLMIGLLLVGTLSWFSLRRETFPRFELEIVLVTVPYPGASPDEVETGICQKIEEAVRSIDGIKKVTSVARENSGFVIVELETSVPSVQKTLGEIESAIDRMPAFPPNFAEEPEIQQLTILNPAIKVALVSDYIAKDNADADRIEWNLRLVAEGIRDDLLSLGPISQAEIKGGRKYQIDVEISRSALQAHGLTLQEATRRIAQQNLELPGGKLKLNSEEVLLRAKNKRVTGAEIANLPLVSQSDGAVLTVGELGTIRDHFEDSTSISRIDGKPGLVVEINAAAREDMLAMAEAVRNYVSETELPPGYSMRVFQDMSVDVQDRLTLLKENGLQGLILVFIVLALFLELRLAFWVALGIPVSILGACTILLGGDATLNMISMFAFLMALGIVVDDAIVIGENIYAHRQMGKPFYRAAVDGAVEVLPSVAASVTTTIIAFVPMFFVTGVMGKFLGVLPLAIIAMLALSLVESAFILPGHLKHHASEERVVSRLRGFCKRLPLGLRYTFGGLLLLFGYLFELLMIPLRPVGQFVGKAGKKFGQFLGWFIAKMYLPALRVSLRHPGATVCSAVSLLLIAVSFVRAGIVPFEFFPKLDSRVITAEIVFPDGTPSAETNNAAVQAERALAAVDRDLDSDKSLVKLAYRHIGSISSTRPGDTAQGTDGGHVGTVTAELIGPEDRSVTSQQIIDAWRKKSGDFAGADSVVFKSVSMGPGGKAIEFKLLAKAGHMQQLEEMVAACKEKLAGYDGVFDISDDSRPGKWEYQLTTTDLANALGVPLQAIAGTVRSSYYGEEVMRVQRGRHEVKLMVRYPSEDRRSHDDLNDIEVAGADGTKRPLPQLANLDISRGYSEINRLQQRRSITITADVDSARANAARIVADLRTNFMPQMQSRFPQVDVRWEGQQEQTTESFGSLFIGFLVAVVVMFGLLTFEFKSYIQPAIILAVIPFGIIGAIFGHAVMGLPLTLFSILGLVALTGVVVNDSIVLVDFINARQRDGMPLEEAILQAGERRFRPVLLTSMTTIAGLFPILLETSFQAQILIPMAASICFGLAIATVLVLFLVPVFYSLYGKLTLPQEPS